MSEVRDRLIIDLNDTINRAKRYVRKEYTFIHEHMLEFTYDVTDAFKKEPELLEDDEIKKLIMKTIENLKPYINELLSDFTALEMTFLCARKDFNYNRIYFWLWLPDTIMTEEQLKEWHKYLKMRGFKE